MKREEDHSTTAFVDGYPREAQAMSARSFARYCAEIGVAPEDAARQRMEQIRQSADESLAALAAKGAAIPQTVLDFQETVKKGDFFRALRQLTIQEKLYFAMEMTKITHLLPINFAYLQTLAQRCGLPSLSRDSPFEFAQFILSTPHVDLFDMEFNAFVSKHTVFNGRPYVCVYEQLFAAATALCSVVLPCLFWTNQRGEVTVASEHELQRRSVEQDFMDACKMALQVVFSERDSAQVSYPRFDPTATDWFYRNLMLSGATDFVWYHEYGHLLMGHLEREPALDLEFEADNFAARALLATFHEKPEAAHWRVTGAIGMLMVLLILEGRQPTHGTHPSAPARLQRVQDHYEGLFIPVANGIATLCNPSLHDSWKFEIDLRRSR